MQEPPDPLSRSDAPDTNRDDVELLACHLGEEVFCIDVAAIRELRGWTRPTPLPHSPPGLTGVINLRGVILPVIDLATLLGLEPLVSDARNVIVVVETGGQLTGLAVSAVSDIHKVAKELLTPPPPGPGEGGSGGAPIAALALIADRMIRIIDLAALLPRTSRDAA